MDRERVTGPRVRPYFRRSIEDAKNRSRSIDIQRDAFRGQLKAHPEWAWDGKEYSDEGQHGWNINRPQLRKAISDGMKVQYDILVVPWRQDRFSRDPEDIKHLLRTFIVLGIGVWMEGRLLDSRESYKAERMMIGIRAEVSSEELSKLHDATRRGMQTAKKNGKRTGQAPTGFDYVRNAEGEADGSGRIALNALGTAGLALIGEEYGEIARRLDIPRTTAWRLKRNLVAFQEG